MGKTLSNYIYQVVIWVFGFNLFSIPLYYILIDLRDCLDPNYNPNFSFGILVSSLFGMVLGLLLGTVDYLMDRLTRRQLSYLKIFLLRAGLYTTFFMLMVFFGGILIRQSQVKDLQTSVEFVTSEEGINTMWAYFLFAAFFGLIVTLIGQVRQMFGQGELLPLFLGRYSTPSVEERIFMFLDLRSSTTIAEQLGHIRFSRLIQDCFYDLNQVITPYRASIYQYVGDEAVISWRSQLGTKNNNCLRLFYAYSDRLRARKAYYKKEYGVLPEFKAGLNIGEATVTEVGDLKKEIAFHGDVLNTAARIQSICNQYRSDLLISATLARLLDWDGAFEQEALGELELKGKKEPVGVVKVSRKVEVV